MLNTILIVEDDTALQRYLKDYLTETGYSVKTFSRGSEVLKKINDIRPDLIVLDLNLPDLRGESLCAEIKKDFSDLPIIVLTGKTNMSDKLNAFQLGADDYVTKPFDAEELLARIKVQLKSNTSSNVLKVGDLAMNKDSMEVTRGSKRVYLTPQEYKLLEVLIANKNKVLSRETLLNKIWPNSFEIESRVVDVYISYLRKKIDTGFKKKLIFSSRGFGYSLKD
jgi:DNA-binding response OmpR family regulator